jgi:hypothetical protein
MSKVCRPCSSGDQNPRVQDPIKCIHSYTPAISHYGFPPEQLALLSFIMQGLAEDFPRLRCGNIGGDSVMGLGWKVVAVDVMDVRKMMVVAWHSGGRGR